MDTTQMKRYEMLVRVNQFGETHGDLFRKTSQARQHFADVAAAVKELSGYTIDKMRATDEGKTNKAAARGALSSRLRAIGRTARLIAADNPGMGTSSSTRDRRRTSRSSRLDTCSCRTRRRSPAHSLRR